MTTETKILRGRNNICRYLDNMNRNAFYKWVRKGMPAYKADGVEWVSHKEALDEFFYHLSINKGYKSDTADTPVK